MVAENRLSTMGFHQSNWVFFHSRVLFRIISEIQYIGGTIGMTDAQVVKRAKCKSSVKDPGVRGILKMTRERFVFMPNDPSSSIKHNVEFRLIKGHKSSKEGSNRPALLNLTHDQGNYIFEFKNFPDRELCRDFVGEVFWCCFNFALFSSFLLYLRFTTLLMYSAELKPGLNCYILPCCISQLCT